MAWAERFTDRADSCQIKNDGGLPAVAFSSPALVAPAEPNR
jgi:hypothetical protein